MQDNGLVRLRQTLYEGIDTTSYQELHWQGNFDQYLEMVYNNPKIIRNAFQRLYEMIISYGTEQIQEGRKKITRYLFFKDPMENGKDALFGIEEHLARFVDYLKAAAYGYGPDRRLLLLHGPVGSAKSTIVRLCKKGLEAYSKTREGALYTFMWQDDESPDNWIECPMHEEPLKLIPKDVRQKILAEINKLGATPYQLNVEGDLCPFCRRYFNIYMQKYKGNLQEVLKHLRVKRLILSEKDRIGIGTFQPKDEKNQDSTELTGDINYRKIAEYGSDSDPRAFNFDGEFNVANRGLIEFIEVLKLDVAFLYDLLGATQEHVIKPKKFAQTDIDEVIIAHTNEPEYRRLKNNDLMEAFRDRTLKIDVPYNLKLDNEIKIYERDYGPTKIKGRHIAPHTLEIAAMWAILTRLKPPKKNISLMQKLKLYNGKTLPGFTEENIKELMAESEHEGMEGISPRYIQDKLSTALVRLAIDGCLNPFMLIKELEDGLDHHALITTQEQKARYKELLSEVRVEYEDIVKNEVQRAICADEDAINRLFQNYVDHVKAYTQKQKVRNKITGEDEEPDERLMRSIEEKIQIAENRKDDFRRELMNYIGALAVEGKKFSYKDNERLQKALELKLFEDQKDTIRLASLVSGVVDAETQEKIDIVKARLKKSYGYCDICAQDVLTFVASIFARGDVKKTG